MKAGAATQRSSAETAGTFPDENSLTVVHQTRGRLRVKVRGLRGLKALGVHLQRELGLVGGVRRISSSSATGNLLVHHDNTLTPSMLLDAILSAYEGFQRLTPEERGHLSRTRLGSAPARAAYDESPLTWHVSEPEQVLAHFQVSPNAGLAEKTALERLAASGPNALPSMLPRSFPQIFAAQIRTLPVLLIFGAAGLSVLTGAVAEGVIAAGIALVNAFIGAAAESRAERTLEVARDSVALSTQVLREGKVKEIGFQNVVPGDVIELQVGSRVPADARLIEAENLCVDESALTGESIPVAKFVRAHRREHLPISLRKNMLYRGTLVVEGRGRAVAVATGKDTALGKLQRYLGVVFPPEALMARGVRRLSLQLLLVSGGASFLFSLVSLLRGQGLLQVFRQSLSFLAGSVPSGLSTLSLSAFALSHRNMQRHRILVRRLRALASLASTQVVCFDKTGTLTYNRMTAAEIHAGGRLFRVRRVSGRREGTREAAKNRDISWLATLTALCNETPAESLLGTRPSQSSSTERALLLLAKDMGLDVDELRRRHPIQHIQKRSEKHPFMVTVHSWRGRQELTAVKGSPLDVLERCAYWNRNGKTLPLGEQERSRIERENFSMSGNGLRVLGVAYRWGRINAMRKAQDQGWELVWAGLVGFEDPLREGTRALIQSLHKAGIKTAVITGDQSLTAGHVGEALNVAGEEPLRILDAMSFRDLDAGTMRNLVTRTHVFARLNPTQKLQVIQAYQSAGIGVVMVGDGINDVLALKVADVGIAMGRDGTDLARRSADLVLQDDDLRKVAVAIAAGRGFYANIERSLRFLVTANQVDLTGNLLAKSVALGGASNPWQSLWTNLVCLSLASQGPGTGRLHSSPAAEHGTALETPGIEEASEDALRLMAAAGPTGLYGLARYGSTSDAGRLFFRGVAVNQLLYALACRDADSNAIAKSEAGPLLPLTLLGAVGGYFVLTLFRGWGGVLDAVALGTSALLSSSLAKGRR